MIGISGNASRFTPLPPEIVAVTTEDQQPPGLIADRTWFCWSLHTEAACIVNGVDARLALMLAGVAMGCPVNFVWRGHRRSRAAYRADDATAALLRARGLHWAEDAGAARAEIHALYRIREWGVEDEAPPQTRRSVLHVHPRPR